ncbi:MAG: hypothetical protein QM756_44835 [Polyangiaceae bacterium]
MSDDEFLLFERLREQARRERAPAALASRILDSVRDDARRESLIRENKPQRRGRALLTAASGVAIAAGVAFALSRPHGAPSIAQEHTGGSQRATTPPHATLDPCLAVAVASGEAPLVDDFEDGDDGILQNEQRLGFWRWVRETDAPGTAPALLPIPRPTASANNRLALHVKGGRLSDWGAAVEFTFRPACYDASRYVGIAFSARGPGRIYVAPRETSVIPVAEGGNCERDCHNPHTLKVDLDDKFRAYQVRFDDMHQRGVDRPPLNAKRLNSLAFLVRPEDTPYDVWLDDVRFIER